MNWGLGSLSHSPSLFFLPLHFPLCVCVHMQLLNVEGDEIVKRSHWEDRNFSHLGNRKHWINVKCQNWRRTLGQDQSWTINSCKCPQNIPWCLKKCSWNYFQTWVRTGLLAVQRWWAWGREVVIQWVYNKQKAEARGNQADSKDFLFSSPISDFWSLLCPQIAHLRLKK